LAGVDYFITKQTLQKLTIKSHCAIIGGLDVSHLQFSFVLEVGRLDMINQPENNTENKRY